MNFNHLRYIVALVFMMSLGLKDSQAQVVVVKRHVPPRGRTVVKVDHSVAVVHHGTTLHYSRGVFYRPVVGRGYVVVAPPIGVRVAVLPPSYVRITVGGGAYFYYAGIFYQPVVGTKEYVVVSPPLGARVTVLPQGYSIKVINDTKYYIVDDTYYVEKIESNKVAYEVVNKPVETQQTAQVLMNGARLPHLPDSAEVKVIDGHKYYVSENIYFKEIIERDTIWYEVVGDNI